MVHDIYKVLLEKFGEQGWWPITPKGKLEAAYDASFKRRRLKPEEQFEICAGAILTQNTAWTNVRKALSALQEANLMAPGKIHEASQAKLARLIRSSGYFRQKAKKLKAFCAHLAKYQYDIGKLLSKPGRELREELLSLHGIGPETADSMLLYAAQKPLFVVDAYTRRIGRRVRLFRTDDYHQIQKFFHKRFAVLAPEARVPVYNEYHALLVALGKAFCKTKPLCAPCPLTELCPTAKFHD